MATNSINNSHTSDWNSNHYNINFEGDESAESINTFEEKYEDASLQWVEEDRQMLRSIKKRKMEFERNEDVIAAIRQLQNEMERSNRAIREDMERSNRAIREDMERFNRAIREDMERFNRVIREDMERSNRVIREDIGRLSYRNMVVENTLLASAHKPIQVIPFLTGEGPNEGDLPPIRNIISILDMNEEDVVSYLRGYNIERLPPSLLAKKKKLAAFVGLADQDDLLA